MVCLVIIVKFYWNCDLILCMLLFLMGVCSEIDYEFCCLFVLRCFKSVMVIIMFWLSFILCVGVVFLVFGIVVVIFL